MAPNSGKSGRKPALDAEQMKNLRQLILDNPDITLEEIKEERLVLMTDCYLIFRRLFSLFALRIFWVGFIMPVISAHAIHKLKCCRIAASEPDPIEKVTVSFAVEAEIKPSIIKPPDLGNYDESEVWEIFLNTGEVVSFSIIIGFLINEALNYLPQFIFLIG